MTAAPVTVGPPRYATGSTGTILAIPPVFPGGRWAFHVDGCSCGMSSHATLAQAELCSRLVCSRSYRRKEIEAAIALITLEHPELLAPEKP